jgi:hypothetical protein
MGAFRADPETAFEADPETFWTDAEGLFETARQAGRAGSPDCDVAILIGPQGDIQLLEAAGWALPGLVAERGACAAYRVTRERGAVRLEGRRGSQTCLLRSESPAAVARHLLGTAPAYLRSPEALAASRPCPALLPAAADPPLVETWTNFA